MKKKKYLYPKPVLKKFSQEVVALMHKNNEGHLILLERIEEIPYEARLKLIEEMSAFYQTEMVEFFYLLKREYAPELDEICDKALDKYRMAGMDVSVPEFFKGEFYKAFASCTRHTGRVTLDVAWVTEGSALHVECFYLTYNPDGIHSFILVDDIPIDTYEDERQYMPDMVEVNFAEVCCLIYQAYANNLRYKTAPALGRFLYQKYIDYFIMHDTPEDYINLIRRISAISNPRQLVNSYFQGIKNRDHLYLEALTNDSENFHRNLANLSSLLSAGTMLLEAQAQEVKAAGDYVLVSANAYTAQSEDIYVSRLRFHLTRDEQRKWYIDDFELLEQENLSQANEANHFIGQVLCRIYYISDVDELFDMLEKVDNINRIEELTYGVHMRITEDGEDHNQGVVFFKGVVADIVINNGEELALISKHKEFIDELHKVLSEEYSSTVIPLGTYETDMLAAYKYINGQYKSFEDILYDNAAGTAFDDGMRCLSVSYYVHDRAKVSELLNEVKDIAVDLSPDRQVYYQFDHQPEGAIYFVEYMLASDWLSISAFGEKDLNTARLNLQKIAGDFLDYEGQEKRCGSIFDILNTGIKKDYPELEKALKEMYLNKWYYSSLSQLQGMSPSEASQTEEGNQLLWGMLKRFRLKEKNSNRRRLSLHEYIRKLEQKEQEKQ